MAALSTLTSPPETRIVIEKVKAHATWTEVMEGKISYFDYVENRAADMAAKEALAVARKDAPAGPFNAAIVTAVLWADRMLDYATVWDPRCAQTEEAAEEVLARLEAQRDAWGQDKRNTTAHKLRRNSKCMRCRRCGRESTDKKLTPTFGPDAYKGTVEGRIVTSSTGNKSYLWSKHRFTRAEMAAGGYPLARDSRSPYEAIDEARL